MSKPDIHAVGLARLATCSTARASLKPICIQRSRVKPCSLKTSAWNRALRTHLTAQYQTTVSTFLTVTIVRLMRTRPYCNVSPDARRKQNDHPRSVARSDVANSCFVARSWDHSWRRYLNCHGFPLARMDGAYWSDMAVPDLRCRVEGRSRRGRKCWRPRARACTFIWVLVSLPARSYPF